jgi:hypothetical protein
VKRDGRRQPVKFDKITARIKKKGTRLNIVEVDFPAERAEDLNQQWSGV